MKNILNKLKYLGLLISIFGMFFATPVQAEFWAQNATNSLATNTGNGLAGADIHVAHCYIGLGTGTPCSGGATGVTSLNTLTGALTIAAGTGISVTPSGGNTLTIAATGSSGVTTMGTFGSSANANGGTISGSTLTLQPANASNPGGVSINNQTFAGTKATTIWNALTEFDMGGVFLSTQDNTNKSVYLGNGSTHTTASNITVVGVGSSGVMTTAATNDTIIGSLAYLAGTSAADNTIIGAGSGTSLITGGRNVIIGSQAGRSIASNDGTTIVGYAAGTGSPNPMTAIGFLAGGGESSGSGLNTYLGYSAGLSNLSGSKGTYLGDSTDNSGNFSNSTALGYGAVIGAANQIVFGQTATPVNKWKVAGIDWTMPAAQGGANTILNNDGSGNLTWIANSGASAVTSIGTFGSTPNSAGGSISANVLTLQPANGTNPGGVSTAAQTLAGAKTFSGGIFVGTTQFAVNTSGNITKINNVTTSFPGSQGGIGSVLNNNGSGTLTWSNILTDTSTNASVNYGSRFLADSSANTSVDWQNRLVKDSGGTTRLTWSTSGLSANAGNFTIDTSGNITKLNNVTTSFPGSQGGANTILNNDGAGTLTWITNTGASAATSIGALDAQAANANGLALVSNVLSAQSADATHPGMVNNTTQTFSGTKTDTVWNATTQYNFGGNFFASQDATNTSVFVGNGTKPTATGTGETITGYGAGHSTLTGNNNTIYGAGSGVGLTSGAGNTVVGQSTATGHTTGSNTIAIGMGAEVGVGTSSNITIGQGAGSSVSTGSNMICIGTTTCTSLTTAQNGVFIGSAGTGNDTVGGNNNIAIGTNSHAGTGTNNLSLGNGIAGSGLMTGSRNTFVGNAEADNFAVTGSDNFCGGEGACDNFQGAATNVAIGSNTAHLITSGSGNTLLGYGVEVGGSVTNDTYIGSAIGNGGVTSTSTNNTFVGSTTAAAITSASNIVSLGQGNLAALTTGGSGVVIGQGAGATEATGTNYIVIGKGSNVAASNSTDMIVLGTGLTAGSNQAAIGSSGGITGFFIGKGITAAAPSADVTFQPTGAIGGTSTDTAGSNLDVAGGIGTGSATPAAIIFKTTTVGSTGTTAQTLAERARIDGTGTLMVNTTTAATNAKVIIKDGHIKSTQTTAPVLVPLAGAGAGPTTSLSNATDTAGNISVTAGAGATSGSIVTVSFNKVYATAPVCTLTPTSANSAATIGSYIANSATTGFDVADVVGLSVLTYTWTYQCIETQ